MQKDNKSDWTSQLVMLRDLTKRFGTLHEAQSLQLKLWPFVVDNTLDNSSVGVDIDRSHVIFTWKGSRLNSNSRGYRKRLKELEGSVKFLLGDSWTMEVYADEGKIWPGKAILKVEIQNDARGNKRRNSKHGGRGSRRK